MDIEVFESRFKLLRQRMDNDMNLYRLESYIMRGTAVGDKEGPVIQGATNITLNDPMVFGDAFMSVMQMDKCTREIKDVDQTIQKKIETDLKKWLYLNDEWLAEKNIESLDDCLNFQSGFRGWLCGLPLIREQGGKYQVTIEPVDPRWCSWELGERGMKKFVYSVRMDKEEAEETFNRKFNEQRDVYLYFMWDDKDYSIANFTSAGRKIENIISTEHDLGFCPGVAVPVPKMPYQVVSGLDAATELSYQGESIYAPIRETIPQMNDIASVLASMNKQQFLAPLIVKTDRGIEAFGDGTQFYGSASIAKLEKDEVLERVPVAELKSSMTFLFDKLWASFERSLFSSVNFGQAGDRQSAIAIADLKSDRDKVINPRRKAKETFMRKCIRNLTRMAKGRCYKIDIPEDFQVDIDHKTYENKFTIQINYNSVTPQENIANVELATRYANMGYPPEWIMTNITHEENPAELVRQSRLEKLYQMIPQAMIYDAAMADAEADLTEKKIKDGRLVIIMSALEQQLGLAAGTIGQNPSMPSPQPMGEKPPPEKLASEKLKQTGQQNIIEARRAQ